MKSGKMTTLPDEIALDQAYDYDERAIVFDGINSYGQICFSKRGWSIYCSYRLLTRLSKKLARLTVVVSYASFLFVFIANFCFE